MALLGAALLAVWLLVNPNDYKGRIAAAVKESTGRELKLAGDIKLSVFPWVALEVGPASLGNPPGFGDEPFLSFTHAALRVRLLPLLQQRLEVARVEIDGLDLRLRKKEDGRPNWEAVRPAPEPSTGGAEARPQGMRLFDALADLRIHNGHVSYHDISIEHLNLETGSIAHEHDIPITLTFDANRGARGTQITVNARFDVNEDGLQHLRFAAVNGSGIVNRPGEGRAAHWELSVPTLSLNPTQQTLEAPTFAFNYSNAHLTGSLIANHLLEEAALSGSVTLMPLVLHEFFPRLGIVLPITKDPKALSQLSGKADFVYAAHALSLKNVQARLDDTQFQGSIQLSARDPDALQFDLSADQIDVDRYRFVRAGTAVPEAQGADQPAAPTHPREAAGALAVASAHFAGMEFTHLRLTLQSKDRVTHLFPTEAQIDGGRYNGDITLDDRGALRVVSINEHLTGIDISRLLANSPQKHRLSGRATLSLKGMARGATMDALRKTLTGQLEADLSDGAFEGVDLGYEVNRARALIDRGVAPQEDTKRTKFEVFKTSAQINNGLAETHDLTIASPALRVTGQGSANLSTQAIDFQLMASVLKSPTTTLVDIPLKVTGTYADPAVKASIDEVAKSQLKQKLQDILKKNGLQGLFGK